MFVLFFSKKGRFTFVDRPSIGVPENFNFWGEREHGENSYERCPFIVLSRSSREELLPRVELGTSSLPRMRSTTELKQHKSERRDSNPRPPAWKASALSTELLSRRIAALSRNCVGADGFEPPKSKTADLQSAPFGHSGTHPNFKEL